jgi:Mn2+/Fe2+ NRAMP family transporter
VMIMLLASRRKVMRTFRLPLRLKLLGWGATLVMAAVTIAMFATLGR